MARKLELSQRPTNHQPPTTTTHDSCPAVSQIWILIFLSSMTSVCAPNSTPMVTS